jgi:outer membrane protein assembly factor BamD
MLPRKLVEAIALIARTVALAVLALPVAGWTEHREHLPRLAQSTEAAGQATDVERQAARHMEIGRWHLGQRNCTGALNRFVIVATCFQASAQVEEALARLVEAYLTLGLACEAPNRTAVLLRTFPDGQWTAHAREALNGAGIEPVTDERPCTPRPFKHDGGDPSAPKRNG